jgi:hypothetical protein
MAKGGLVMTQAFRQMPRRVGSRPGGFRSVNDAPQESPAIQGLLRQASQLHHHIQQLPASSAARGPLQKKLTTLHDQLHQLRSEARAHELTLKTQTPHDEAALARAFFQALYAEKHPLPRHLRMFYQAAVSQQAMLDFHQALQPLYEALILREQGAWQGFWQIWLPAVGAIAEPLVELPSELSPESEPDIETDSESDDDFEVLTFATPTRPLGPRPGIGTTLRSPLQGKEGLQVSFDLKAGQSTVRNAMGISLNQPKKNYGEYLRDGFYAIDRAVASGFEERYRLEHGIVAFLEAMSLDKSRHEAYFGLGYLYALVQDANHALYFLDVACKISKDPAIVQLRQQVRAQLVLNKAPGVA